MNEKLKLQFEGVEFDGVTYAFIPLQHWAVVEKTGEHLIMKRT